MVETLKKRTNIGGDVKETDKYWWRRQRNRQMFVEVVNETDKYWWKSTWRSESNRQIFAET